MIDLMTEGVQVFTILEPEIREAAGRVSRDWPSVTSHDDLANDLASLLFEREFMELIWDMPGYRRRKFLTSTARNLVLKQIAEFEHNTGNVLYSVGEVKFLLKSGGLINSRTQITATLPDLDEGCRYLSRVLPVYSRLIYAEYVDGNTRPVDLSVIDAAVRALTDCMNNINQGRKIRV